MTRFLILLAVMLAGCTQSAPEVHVHKREFFAFGTLVNMSIVGVDEATAQKAFDLAREDFELMHTSWHPWQPGSLARTNSLMPLGAPFSVGPSVKPLILEATRLYEQTGGLFNPAIGGFVKLWGFHEDEMPKGPPPADAEIQGLLAKKPAMTDLRITDFTLENSNPAVLLDFGAFAKGYGIDGVVDHLRRMGIENAIVNAGGDLRAIGSKAGKPWVIGIRNPRGAGVFASVEISGDESVFTSGDYERFYEYEGKRYHHIIDPRTGYPARGTTSVTVIHKQAAVADAASTALFVAGPAEWQSVANKMGVQYVMRVDDQGIVYVTPAMRDRIQFLVSPAPELRLGGQS